MGPPQSRVEGKENLPRSAGHTPLNGPSEDGEVGDPCSHLTWCFGLALGFCSGMTGLFVLWPPPGRGFVPFHPSPLRPSAEPNTEITFFFPRLCAKSDPVEHYAVIHDSFLLFPCVFYGKTSSAATQVGLCEEPQQKGTLHRDGSPF